MVALTNGITALNVYGHYSGPLHFKANSAMIPTDGSEYGDIPLNQAQGLWGFNVTSVYNWQTRTLLVD